MKENAATAQKIAEDYGMLELKKIFNNSKTRYTVIAENGGVIYDNKKQGEEASLEKHNFREEIKMAESGKESFSIRKSRTLGEDRIYYALPMKNGMIIRDSQFKEGSSYDSALTRASDNIGDDIYGFRKEFLEIIKKAKEMDQ